jgi:hypothetical protein
LMGRAEIKDSRPQPLGARPAGGLLPRRAAERHPAIKSHRQSCLIVGCVSGQAGLPRAAQGLPLLHGNVACKPMVS